MKTIFKLVSITLVLEYYSKNKLLIKVFIYLVLIKKNKESEICKDLTEVLITNQGPKRCFQFFNIFPFIQIWSPNIVT